MTSYIFLASLGILPTEATGYLKADQVVAVFTYDGEGNKYRSIIIIGNRQFRSIKSPLEIITTIESYLK